jgi:hypothetical protein
LGALAAFGANDASPQGWAACDFRRLGPVSGKYLNQTFKLLEDTRVTEETQLDRIRKRTVVYRVPEMDAVSVRQGVEYRVAGGESLTLDLYYPPHQESKSGLPVLVFVMGYSDAGMQRILGCRAKEMGQYTSWARLAASSGMAAVTYGTLEPASDVHEVLRHLRENAASLGLDASRIAVWSCSGNVPNALQLLLRDAPVALRCAVLAYGLMLEPPESTFVAEAQKIFGFVNPTAGRTVADLRPDTPIFLARAGRDETPHLNDTIDHFVAAALALDLPLTLVNHRGAPHAFDAITDDDATRELIRGMIAFLRFHLAV